jgi:hypothetical protein
VDTYGEAKHNLNLMENYGFAMDSQHRTMLRFAPLTRGTRSFWLTDSSAFDPGFRNLARYWQHISAHVAAGSESPHGAAAEAAAADAADATASDLRDNSQTIEQQAALRGLKVFEEAVRSKLGRYATSLSVDEHRLTKNQFGAPTLRAKEQARAKSRITARVKAKAKAKEKATATATAKSVINVRAGRKIDENASEQEKVQKQTQKEKQLGKKLESNHRNCVTMQIWEKRLLHGFLRLLAIARRRVNGGVAKCGTAQSESDNNTTGDHGQRILTPGMFCDILGLEQPVTAGLAL